MIARGYTCNLDTLDYSIVKKEHMQDWTPDSTEVTINSIRILDRLLTKHNWFKHFGSIKDKKYWLDLYLPLIKQEVIYV